MAAAKITFTYQLISFGASLEVAAESSGTEMKILCVGSNGHPQHTPTPLTAPRQCAECGEITDYTGIVKGIKQGSSYAITTQEQVAEAVIQNSAPYHKKVTLVAHPVADFEGHTAPGKSLYYVVPDPAAADHYALMVRLITSHPELSFASLYTPRTSAGLYCVKVRDGVLVLEQRTRGQALKPTPAVGGTVNDQLYGMAEMMLSASVTPYDADAYEDTYAKAVNLLAVQAQDVVHVGKTTTSATTPVTTISDTDLMAKMAALVAAQTVAA